ncbi:MAG: XRE family transcriptional regulator [Bacteroidetes bacterium]|jgi:HTH-type transcriptional regulator/antitoxin HigA|nr:XRE family transcriptional regulator [Bacteroidota bacterium]
MSTKKQWFLIDSEKEYNAAVNRYEQVKQAANGTEDHKEKMLLVHLIADYEKSILDLPEVDPVELIKIRLDDFGYKPSDLAAVYGDKGTISKVLNYKQALSLTMIRKFSDFLKLPVDSLIKEYKLKTDF